MALKYLPFTASSQMVSASRNAPPLRWGAKGTAVGLLQAGLVQLGFPLPKSTKAMGVLDAMFGDETRAALIKFQETNKLKPDGVAGKNTITLMDGQLAASSKPPPFHPPPRPAPVTSEYELGRGDPPRGHDAGSGRWNSSPKEAGYIALGTAIVAVLPVAYGAIGDDATLHLIHYFGNQGSTYQIDLEGMVRDVSSAKELYEDEVAQAKEFVEMLALGRHDIRSRRAQNGYNLPDESRNWYYAIGGYSVWGSGTAVVSDVGGQRQFELDFQYSFFDRYNWDKGKSVEIGGITITDQFMGEFHRQGLAQEFDCVGSFKRRFAWTAGSSIPVGQLGSAGGRA